MPTNNQNYVIMYTVHGEAEALSYPVAPGQSVILIDSDNPVIYVKSANALGQPLPLVHYDLVQREVVAKEAAPAPVLGDEVGDLIDAKVKEALTKYFPQINFN